MAAPREGLHKQERVVCWGLWECASIKDHDGESGSSVASAWRVLSGLIFYLFNCFCERAGVLLYYVVL